MIKKFQFYLIISFLFIPILFSYEYDTTFFSIKNGIVTDKVRNYNGKINLETKTLSSNYKGIDRTRQLEIPSIKFPVFTAKSSLIDNLYYLAIQEIILNINQNGYFVAGEKWSQAWTRDMSYAIFLSLSFLFNEQSVSSLNTRVEDGLILQDTGTGGSYPVSTDRIVWALASYETALIKNDFEYYKQIYTIIKNSILQDYQVVYDNEKNLFYGEQSFLDWREQTYPMWMEPVDIANSFALNTNVLFYMALESLQKLANILNLKDDEKMWENNAQKLKSSIIKSFWIEKRNYLGAYIINGAYPYLYEGYETLGNSLSIISGITNPKMSIDILNAVTPSPYGMPVVSPQLTNISPYHNDGIWPFVQGYRGLAAKQAGDIDSCEFEFASILYSASLFLTFKENLVASTGEMEGTAINSDRQLWSVAAYLSYIFRVLCGLNFTENGIQIRPLVFDSLKNGIKLSNFKIQNLTLNLDIKGTGNSVESFFVNGKRVDNDYTIPYNTNETISVSITVSKKSLKSEKINVDYSGESYAPAIPYPSLFVENKSCYLDWNQTNETGFEVFKNGKVFDSIKSNELEVSASQFADEYFLLSRKNNLPVLKGTPIWIENKTNTLFIEAEAVKFSGGTFSNKNISGIKATKAGLSYLLDKSTHNGRGYVANWGKDLNQEIEFIISIKKDGKYMIDFRYQNGNGAVNTGERCAIRSCFHNDKLLKRIIFPQRGNWMDWGFSTAIIIDLKKGKNSFKLLTDEYCYSQKRRLVKINLDLIRIRNIE